MISLNKKQLFSLGLCLFVLGFVGILSMLTMDISLPADVEQVLKKDFSDQQIKYLILVNPTILLLVAVVLGTILYNKVNLNIPVLEKVFGFEKEGVYFIELIKYGVLYGLISGILLSGLSLLFTPMLPFEFKVLGNAIQPTLAARFLYGGLTEEIMLRFGLMTFVVWLISKLTRSLKPFVYWGGILITAIVFAFSHFPIVFQALDNPSSLLLLYVLLGNSIGGIIFGWLYWKKGLEAAFIAHLFTHVVLVSLDTLLN